MNLYLPIFRDLDARGGRKLRTDRHTHGTTTVTLAAYMRRGLIISVVSQVVSHSFKSRGDLPPQLEKWGANASSLPIPLIQSCDARRREKVGALYSAVSGLPYWLFQFAALLCHRIVFLRGFGDHNFEKKAIVRGYHTYIVQCGLPC